jgi:sedoheptulose-bisphosphatase
MLSTSMHAAGTELVVREFVLGAAGSGWSATRQSISIGENNVFAPANLRATADNAAYKQLVHGWMDARHTLRYSGGMVRFRTARS